MKRRHVLGDICDRCDLIRSVPVYHTDEQGEMLGYADESTDQYADAFTFHVPEDICKRLAAGYYTYSFGCEYVGEPNVDERQRRIKLTSICINERKVVEPVGPRKLKTQPTENPA